MSDTFEIEQEIQVIHIQIGPRLLASQFCLKAVVIVLNSCSDCVFNLQFTIYFISVFPYEYMVLPKI